MSQVTLTADQVRELAKCTRSTRRAEAKAEVDDRRKSYRTASQPVKLRLPFPPMLNHYYRSALIGGHVSTYISTEGQQYRQQVTDLWRTVAVTFDGRLAVRVNAVFPNRMHRDLDGILKSLLDSLEHAGAYANDSQVTWLVVEYKRTEAPGWVDVVIGPDPSERQGSLFLGKD